MVCDRSDGLAFDLLRKYREIHNKKFDIFILSTEKNKVVSIRAMKYKVGCYQGVEDKLSFLKKYLLDRFPADSLKEKGIIYLGNDLNDYSSMKLAGFSVAPIDAHPEIIEIADVVIDRKGGNGFVRTFIEELFKENNVEIKDLL